MSAHRRAARPYRAGRRPVTRDLAVKPHSEHPVPAPGEPGGPGRIDLAFNPTEPRDAKGRWISAGVLYRAPDYDTYRGQRFFRIQNESRDPQDLLDSDNWHSSMYGGGSWTIDPDTDEEVEDVRNGVSVMESEDELAEYLAHSGVEFDPNHSVIVELGGDYSEDDDHDADKGAVLVYPSKILKVQKTPDSFFQEIDKYADLAVLFCAETTEILDLANPSLRRTRYITGQLLNGKDAATLLHHRGISREVAEAVAALAGKGTAVRPNARRRGMPLSLGMRIERDREALYRGAYLLKAGERVQASVNSGKPLREALNAESPHYQAHERARRNRLDAVTETHRVAQRLGTTITTPEGTTRTLLGWYLDPLLQNDPECKAANGHNFYAEEGTVIGFPGAVHLNCGCKAGPPIEGAGLVNDAVRGVVTLGLVSKKPAYTLSRRRKTA